MQFKLGFERTVAYYRGKYATEAQIVVGAHYIVAAHSLHAVEFHNLADGFTAEVLAFVGDVAFILDIVGVLYIVQQSTERMVFDHIYLRVGEADNPCTDMLTV